MRSRRKHHRDVPRYQNIKIIDGFCDYFFKPSNIGEGLVRVDVSLVPFLCAREMNKSTLRY